MHHCRHCFDNGSILSFHNTILLRIIGGVISLSIPSSLQNASNYFEVYSPPLSDLSVLILLSKWLGFEFLEFPKHFTLVIQEVYSSLY